MPFHMISNIELLKQRMALLHQITMVVFFFRMFDDRTTLRARRRCVFHTDMWPLFVNWRRIDNKNEIAVVSLPQ